MIFTGFTDVNGNVIPVQGAGTVYNEEKNSLALGKDTVAIGQDQLVFGRKNIEDANKAEIVGGNEVVTIKTNTFDSGDDYIQPECSIVYVKQFVRSGNPSITYKVGRIVSVASNSYQLGENTQPENVSNMAVGYYAYIKIGTNEINFSTGGNGISSGSPMRYGTDLSLLNSFGNGANIRTLDWDGNEHIGKSLAIGEKSVAGAEGQLAFGRKNEADYTKAEIVGGDDATWRKVPTESINDAFFQNLKEGDIVKIKHGTNYNDATRILRFLTNDISIMSSKISPRTLEGHPLAITFTSAQTVIACFEIADVQTEIGSMESEYFIVVKGDDNYQCGPENTISIDSNTYTAALNLSTYTSVSGNIKSITKKTDLIRTLDWEGNQWNAGDITCDDGNGNTISMRDLLSRIAALEAAQAE